MQLVLSGNRIVAHGEDCFVCMGGTVVCLKTGRTFQNATIAICENYPSDLGVVGYEYRAGEFIPCAPYRKDDGKGYIMTCCPECATPQNSGIRVAGVIGARITVTAPEGSNVVCFKGEKELKGEEENGVLTFYPLDFGVWDITATLGEQTATGKVDVNGVKPFSISLNFTDDVLANNTWATIAAVAKAGNAAEHWNIGDEKDFTIDGVTYTAQIIGFNHDETANPDEYGRTNAGITFQLKDCLKTLHVGSAADWGNSELRTKIAGIFTQTAEDLTEVVVPVKKYYQNESDILTTVTDRFFLLSGYEVSGQRDSYINENEGAQYEFYAAGNSHFKNANGTRVKWWTRTFAKLPKYNFAVTDQTATGMVSSASASNSLGVAFGFCL